MKHSPTKLITRCAVAARVLLALALVTSPAQAQDGTRWYQIEVTVFAHENANTLQEQWPTDELALAYPAGTRELDSLLKHLTLDDWSVLQPVIGQLPVTAQSRQPGRPGGPSEPRALRESNPSAPVGLSAGPEALQRSDYRLPDVARDAFVALPAAAHDFTQTNRALTESSAYRVLTHLAWRQPVMSGNDATPIAITGGRQFGDHHELEGTLTIRFNQSRDRVLLDTHLWLARFSTLAPQADPLRESPQALQLPTAPGADTGVSDAGENDREQTRFYVTEVFPMQDSRAMRSNEFHYLDHPALGVLVQVFPYEPPSAPANAFTGSALPQ
jgi:hypothetical protein